MNAAKEYQSKTGAQPVPSRHGTLTAMPDAPLRRFLKIEDVAEILATSPAQVYSLVRKGDLPAIKLGGRGQWRIEVREIDSFIERQYEETRKWVAEHPFAESGSGGQDTAT